MLKVRAIGHYQLENNAPKLSLLQPYGYSAGFAVLVILEFPVPCQMKFSGVTS